jgi:hypothetical protein
MEREYSRRHQLEESKEYFMNKMKLKKSLKSFRRDTEHHDTEETQRIKSKLSLAKFNI